MEHEATTDEEIEIMMVALGDYLAWEAEQTLLERNVA